VVSTAICRFLVGLLQDKLAQFGTGAEYLFVDLSPSSAVFAYAVVISVMTGVLVGLGPARQATHADVASAMKHETAAGIGGHRGCAVC